jgi:hypothetical protein
MIKIKKDPNADSRSVEEGYHISKESLKKATDGHIKDVREGMKFFSDMILKAGESHDHTKIKYFHDFSELVSNGIKNADFKSSQWYKKHITEERHHLKAHVPEDINLIDIIEYITDCTMAGKSRSGTIYPMNLNKDILTLAFNNTAELLKKNVKVINESSDDLLDSEI